MNRSVSSSLEPLPFIRNPQLGLAPRVRSLIEGIYHTLQPFLDGGLERALDDLERDLLAHVDRTQQSDEQLFAMASLRELKRRRADFAHACRSAVQRGLLALVHAETEAALAADDPLLGSPREEQSMLAQIAARAEIRGGEQWQALGWRLAAIAGCAPIDVEALPIGPRQLCNALTWGARRLDLDAAHRSALFRRIDKTLFSDAQVWATAINRYLVEHRVYAHLQPAVYAEAAAAPRPRVATTPVPPVRAPMPEPAPRAAPAAPAPPERPAEAAVSVVPAAPPKAPEAASESVAAVAEAPSELQQLFDAQSEEERRQMYAQARAAAAVPLDMPFFRSLRELIAARRRSSGSAEGAGDRDRPVAKTADLVAALGELQRQPATPVMVGGRWANRGIAHIRQDLLNLLRGRASHSAPRLREEDQDIFDLVGFLFDRLLATFAPNSSCHALLSRLQVPVLRVALQDPGFFPKRTHPARRLLGWLAEGLLHWVEDEDADRGVVEKLQGVVERLLVEYDGRLDAFERALEEIERQISAMHKKAEIAERRHVEAARGREKLDLAQAAAEEAVRERLAGGWLPAAVATLMQNAWVDAVALAMLRQGVDHPKTRERLDVIDRLIDAFIEQRTLGARLHALDEMRADLEEGLAAIGFHDDAIALAWQDVVHLVESPGEQSRAAAERAIEALIRQRPRLGGETRGGEDEARTAPVVSAEGDAGLLAARAQIEALPFGTWLEFQANPNSPPLRRRLCWFSAVTGRCVLLGPRGHRHEERSLDQLAFDWSTQRLRSVDLDHDHLIDRAWREIMATFRGAALRDARH